MAAPKVEEKKSDDNNEYEPTLESQQPLKKEDLALLEKVKEKYGDRLTPLYPTVIRTFITGYAHTQEREKETYERIDHYFKRYEEFQFATILDEPMDGEDAMFKAWKLFMYGYDNQGHPVVYDEIACSDINTIDAAFKNEIKVLRKYRYRFHRRLANSKRIQSEKLDTLLFKHCLVFDLSGFSSAMFGANYRAIMQEVIGDEQFSKLLEFKRGVNLYVISEHTFPETLHKCFCINTPWAFRLIWKIVSNFIDPITYEKIKVLGTDYLDEMQKTIPIDQIPPKYGGKGKLPIKLGHSADLPHDRYPLDYYEKLKAKSKEPKNNNTSTKPKASGKSEYEAKEQ